MRTDFNGLAEEIKNFEKKAGFSKTSKRQLMLWLKKEIKFYEKSKSTSKKENKLIDIIILTTQLAIRDKIDLNQALKKWWKKSERYLR